MQNIFKRRWVLEGGVEYVQEPLQYLFAKKGQGDVWCSSFYDNGRSSQTVRGAPCFGCSM